MRIQTKKRVYTALLVLFVVLIAAFFSFNKAVRYTALRNEVGGLDEEIQTLQEQNKKLKEEVERLKNDRTYLEDVARREYGLLKKNEMVFDFNKKKKKEKKTSATTK